MFPDLAPVFAFNVLAPLLLLYVLPISCNSHVGLRRPSVAMRQEHKLLAVLFKDCGGGGVSPEFPLFGGPHLGLGVKVVGELQLLTVQP